MKELVSVIIPTYGGAEYLQRAVDSVLAQTYNNIEIVVVDDNGLGTQKQLETAEQMEKYAGNERVKYVCHDVNKKGAAARNTGVKNSSGRYISLLDDDDIYYPENIEAHMKVMKTLPEDYALTYCSHDAYRDGKKFREVKVSRSGSLFYEVMMHNVSIGSPSFLIKREVYEEIGGFDESFIRHQDWEFSARVAFHYKIKASDHMGFRQYYVNRYRHTDAETAKKYREHYLEKMAPYIDALSKKQQKDIRIYNRLGVAFEFFRYGGIKPFIKEYLAIKPGYRGLCFISRKMLYNITKLENLRKLITKKH